jgi:hypothetical protein
MQCCKGQAYDRMFDAKTASRQLKSYERKGATGATARLLSGVREALGTAPGDFTHLDIGGGIGVLQHELAADGATQITAVDASGPYLALLRQAADTRGYGDRQLRFEGDFTAVEDQVAPATVVTLDKVICCYPDMDELVRASAAKATTIYAIVVPRDSWWARGLMGSFNWGIRHLLRREFQAFVHAHDAIDQVCREQDLHLVAQTPGAFMCGRIYRRQRV